MHGHTAFRGGPGLAASHRCWASGANVRINLTEHCGTAEEPAAFTYPANTPFFIMHGWGDFPWVTDTPEVQKAFMAATTYFEFRLDRVTHPSTLFAFYVPPTDTQLTFFISEYDDGLTGTHRFGGLWYLDGALVGGTPGEAVFQNGCVVNVALT